MDVAKELVVESAVYELKIYDLTICDPTLYEADASCSSKTFNKLGFRRSLNLRR